MTDRNTTIRVEAGGEVDVDNQTDCPVRILVVRSDTGDAGHRHLPEGATVRDAVGDTVEGEVRRNGEPVDLDEQVQQGDKVTVTPSNPEGN